MFHMKIIRKNTGYKWSFSNVGGTPRVRIETGEDIAHLSELDPKLWTVLSCPVKGLEISDKSLSYVDVDGDGKIRINDAFPMDLFQRPLRASTPQGERVSLACSERIPEGASCEFNITCLVDDDMEMVKEWLDFGKRNGLGQFRNSGLGRFVWEVIA